MRGPEPLAVIVVTYDSAAHVGALLTGVQGQLDPSDELVVVDNDSRDDTAAVAASAGDGVRVIETGSNLGFASGCHVGAYATTAPLLLFLNPDCNLGEGCLETLRAASARQPDWAAWQAAVLLPDGRINTDGGVVHYLGLGWAGDCGAPIERLPAAPREVGFPSGAALLVRRSAWNELGGLDPAYFLYCEDLDLGLRLRLAGHRVGVIPDARIVHRYEFGKGPEKWFWLERNRAWTVLSVYPAPLLCLLAPALLAAEVALLGVAGAQGWLPAKLGAQLAVLRGLPGTLRRRRAVQATRRITSAEFARHLTASLDSPYLGVGAAGLLARLQAVYWWAVRRALDAADA